MCEHVRISLAREDSVANRRPAVRVTQGLQAKQGFGKRARAPMSQLVSYHTKASRGERGNISKEIVVMRRWESRTG